MNGTGMTVQNCALRLRYGRIIIKPPGKLRGLRTTRRRLTRQLVRGSACYRDPRLDYMLAAGRSVV